MRSVFYYLKESYVQVKAKSSDQRLWRNTTLDNVRIVDASIMPEIPSGNLNAPIIMMAEKMADIRTLSTQFGCFFMICPMMDWTTNN